MYKELKTPPVPPVDVTHQRRLTAEERRAQTCDPRSRLAELSADVDRPVAIADEDQKPNMKALHLHSAAYHWRRPSISYDLLRDRRMEVDAYAVERVGLDFMEAGIASVYGSVAAVDVFSQEVMFDGLGAAALPVGRLHDLIERLRHCVPGLTRGGNQPERSGGNRSGTFIEPGTRVTHAESNNPDKDDELAKAWEALIAPELDPPDVVRRAIRHFADGEPPWVSRVIDRGRAMADAEMEADVTCEATPG